MAFKIIRDELNNEQPGREIVAILDSASDLTALGANYAPGSVAMVAGSGAPTFILNASQEWKEI